jgi:hypothetical protein
VSVGVAEFQDSAGVRMLTVVDVGERIDSGDTFYVAAGSNRIAVAKYVCRECSIRTLRSHAGGEWTRELDSLSPCPR